MSNMTTPHHHISPVKAETYWHRSFFIVIGLKIFVTLCELSIGLSLLVFDRGDFTDALYFITSDQLAIDPHSSVVVFLSNTINSMTDDTLRFLIFYTLTHAFVKMIVFYGLLTKKLWAYPFAIFIFSAFVLQQTYHLMFRFSWGITGMTVLSAIFVVLIWHEYKHMKKRHHIKP